MLAASGINHFFQLCAVTVRDVIKEIEYLVALSGKPPAIKEATMLSLIGLLGAALFGFVMMPGHSADTAMM